METRMKKSSFWYKKNLEIQAFKKVFKYFIEIHIKKKLLMDFKIYAPKYVFILISFFLNFSQVPSYFNEYSVRGQGSGTVG